MVDEVRPRYLARGYREIDKEPHPDMLVVFAGYLKEMDAMLNTNPGLMGRFPYKYQFADYNPDELMEIAVRMLERFNPKAVELKPRRKVGFSA